MGARERYIAEGFSDYLTKPIDSAALEKMLIRHLPEGKVRRVLEAIQDEQAILTEGILACLKGLHEQGANGPVTEAITKIENHLNEKAHGGKKQ